MKVGSVGQVGVLGVEGNGIIQVGDVGSFFKGGWDSYLYFHSSLGLEVEYIAMEGLSRGEVWDCQCKDLEGCCVFGD